MTLSELIEKRERFAEAKHRALLRKVKALQAGLYASLLDNIVSELQTDADGRIRFNSDNLQRVARASVVWAAYRKKSGGLTDWIVKALVSLFGLNTRYFKAVATVSDTLEERSRKLLLKNLGYDLNKGELIKDSWLANLVAQEDVKKQVINRLNAALQSQMSASEFKTQFRDAMLDTKSGLGLATKNMDFHAQNLFMSFDRSAQKVYQEKLGLKYAIYAGTIKKPSKESTGTRDFCWRRVGNLYDVETIDSWNTLNWSGKIQGSDVKVTLGGYKCRHHLSYLSDEMAERLQSQGKTLNKLNPPKPPITKAKK